VGVDQFKRADGSDTSGAGVSIIVPTFREAANVRPLHAALVQALEGGLPGVPWEVIFVDDNSDDGTAEVARALAREDARVRILQRVGRRGLSSAVVEGGFAAIYDTLVVMDGDLQHPPRYIPALVAPVASGEADVSSGSRFLVGASSAGLSSDARRGQSEFGNALVQRLFGVSLTDPLTGFFCLRRQTLAAVQPRLSTLGFKILLDIIASHSPALRTVEVPFEFAARNAGDSKLDARIYYDFFLFILEKKVPGVRLVSPRFVSFALVGGTGVLVHLALMATALSVLSHGAAFETVRGLDFSLAQLIGASGAMVSNFLINNRLTYADKRLKGLGLWRGLVLFAVLSAIGLAANVGVATAVNDQIDLNWSISALAGILVGVVWNFGTTRRLVWKD
jgi:dolichol-phosphate mannosyltransferase